MCILLNVKKHEKTFALNVDIFKAVKKYGGDVKKVIPGMLPLFQEIEEMVALSVQIVLL